MQTKSQRMSPWQCRIEEHSSQAKDTSSMSAVVCEQGRDDTDRSPDERSVSNGIHDGQRTCFAFFGLPTGRRDPAENDRVDCICSNSEDDHCEVPGTSVERCASKDETKDSYRLGNGDMPCALVEFARLP